MICASILFTDKSGAVECYSGYKNANGFIVEDSPSIFVLTDERATATNDWQRQIDITEEIARSTQSPAIVLFSIANDWAMNFFFEDAQVSATYSEDFDDKNSAQLVNELHQVMEFLSTYFGVDVEWLNENLGALYLKAITAEEFFNELLVKEFGVSPYWIRWSYYDLVIENMITDPDLSHIVNAVGELSEL